MDFRFETYANKPVNFTRTGLEVGGRRVRFDETLDCGSRIGPASVEAVAGVARRYEALTHGQCRPQLAALVFAATGQPRALDRYFAIVRTLAEPEVEGFYRLVGEVAQHFAFDLRLIGERRIDRTAELPVDARHLVAGHLAEVFFYRRDILERLLNTPRHVRLYTTPIAFQDDGGEAGGDYSAERESIQLQLSRIFEGFYGETPGVAPFLHEFGHLLDHFDAATGQMGYSQGLLPGLSPYDGPIYTPHARQLFRAGKQLENERYLRRYYGQAGPNDPLPIGHPYVFQNDTEFIAGYFEMFFRNPNYFATQNPDLYQAFVELFRQDTRRAWPQDFPFYVNSNRDFYLRGGERPWPPDLHIPAP